MPGDLQRTPEGFLDLTGQRVGGRYPRGISDTAVPVIDITHLLDGRLVASATAISLTSAVGDQAVITVPDNENWMLFNVSCEWTPGDAGNLIDFKVFLDTLPGSNDPLNKLIVASWEGNNGHQITRVPAYIENFAPIALTPGVRIVAEVFDGTHDATFALHAGIVRLTGN